ncbi:MAG TPA: glycosyltransferase [Candidatus Saccharimonadales bacterium]|nr:glycosyltransferase [Candidatus Saccharimonadales bacterium]
MKSPFLESVQVKKMLAVNLALAAAYFVGLFVVFQRGNMALFITLLVGEVFHLWQLATLTHAAWDTRTSHPFDPALAPAVDIYITVAGEPLSVVEKTVQAATRIDYPNYKVYILNDGLVAKKDNWQDMETLAKKYQNLGVHCITRTTPGGAKAGNINHALSKTRAPFVAILDCDHIPNREFLRRMMGYFVEDDVAFVQSPQYYRNHTKTFVANAAWGQQTLFFGPICRGKDRTNSLFMCGTNMVIRRKALDSVGGMKQDSITEDLLTSIVMHAKGWRSVYVPRILARGLAPEDLSSYWQQQFRWARGSLEVLTKYNPLFLRGLSFAQRLQYLASVTYYLTGLIVLVDAALPLFYFYAGLIPVTAATMSIALLFVPYIFLTLYLLQRISNYSFSFRAIAFSLASWPIYALALLLTVFRVRSGFKVTAKEGVSGNYFGLAAIHLLYTLATLIGIGFAFHRDGLSTSLITNGSWGLLYVVMFAPFIRAAMSDRVASILPYDELELPAEVIHE